MIRRGAHSPLIGQEPLPVSTPSTDEFVLSIYPTGSQIVATASYRPGYRAYPMRVGVGPAIRRCC